MRSKKTYIILIGILVVFFLVMFLIFGLDNIKKDSYDTTIVTDNAVWTMKKQRWDNVTDFTNLNWKKYDVYTDNIKKGEYYLWYNSKWYAFDKDKNAILLDGNLLGIKSNYDISVLSFDISEIDDYNYINSILEENDLPTDSEYTSSYKVELDYDSDGEEETFYVISNAFPMDFNPDKIFSIVFMVKNEAIYPIYTNIEDNMGFNGCKPYINSFIDVDSDSKYEIILNCGKYSVSSTTSMLYEFKNNEFKMVISNNK